MIPANELELSGILTSPTCVFLIMSSAEEVPIGEHISVPFEGRSRTGKVEECMLYRDRYLLWVELVQEARRPEAAEHAPLGWPVPCPVRIC